MKYWWIWFVISLHYVGICCQSDVYFERNCPQLDGSRYCKFDVGSRLDFNDFKAWAQQLPSRTRLHMKVSCRRDARFLLPWPMRAKGLKTLQVHGCVIEGLFSEIGVRTNLLDELEVMEIDSCSVISTVQTLFDITVKHITKEYNCGQQTLKRSIWRNVTYIFPEDGQQTQNFSSDLIINTSEVDFKIAENQDYKCIFPHLEYLEKSYAKSSSKVMYMVKNSAFPNVKTFILANDGYPNVPDELLKWYATFPQLRYLDLSRNSISTFDFLAAPYTGSIGRTDPLLVSLSKNQVSTIPPNIMDHLSNTVPIIVDLTDNPLTCNCDFWRYKNYVLKVVQMYPKLKYLTKITCYSNQFRTWIKLQKFDVSNNICLE